MKPLALFGQEKPLTRVRINRDGDLLFTSSKDSSPCLYYMENGERIGTYRGHSGVVWDIDVSWDSKKLATASGDQHAMFWDVEFGKCLGKRQISTPVRSISMSFSGNLVAYTSIKVSQSLPTLVVVDMRDSGQMKGEGSVGYATLENSAECCVFSHLDDKIVVGTENGCLNQYDLRNFHDAVNFAQPHKQRIRDLQVSYNQGLLISSSSDRTAQLHDANTLDSLKTYTHGRPVNSAAISPTHDFIVLGGGEEAMQVTQTSAASGQFEAKIYDMIYENDIAFFKGHFGPINTLAYSPDGRTIVTGSEDGYVKIQEMDQEYFDYQSNPELSQD